MSTTRSSVRVVRFCLDANISYRVVEAFGDNTHITHVSHRPELASGVKGHSSAEDLEVARWCVTNEHVLVTCDPDFRGRSTRNQELVDSGVEAIVFTRELSGLNSQIDTINRRLPLWQQQLSRKPYAPRVWLQFPRGSLRRDRAAYPG